MEIILLPQVTTHDLLCRGLYHPKQLDLGVVRIQFLHLLGAILNRKETHAPLLPKSCVMIESPFGETSGLKRSSSLIRYKHTMESESQSKPGIKMVDVPWTPVVAAWNPKTPKTQVAKNTQEVSIIRLKPNIFINPRFMHGSV